MVAGETENFPSVASPWKDAYVPLNSHSPTTQGNSPTIFYIQRDVEVEEEA